MLKQMRDQGLERLNGLAAKTGLGPVFDAANARLLWATVASARHSRLDRDMLGFSIEEDLGEVSEEDARLYALGTNDQGAYGGVGGVTPPLLLSRLVQPLLIRVMTEPRMKLNLLKLVHGEQVVRWHAPIRVGDRITGRVEVTAIEETPAGELLRLVGSASRGSELLAEAEVGLMIRGKGGGPRKPKSVPPADPEPAFTLDLETRPDQTFLYAEGSGDTNFIHTSEWLAKAAGLPRTIVHGMCVLGIATHRLADHVAGGDRERLAEIGVRFAAPVFPGQTVTLRGYPEVDGVVPFDVVNPKGKKVLKNGRLRLKG